MSWLDDIVETGSGLLGGILGGSSNIGSNLAKTALMGFALNKITQSITPSNTASAGAVASTPEVDRGVRLQVEPDSNHKIPVVYGAAYLGGIITDAEISNNNLTMHYCITICEKTGPVDIGQGADSSFTFKDIYWNEQRIVFNEDGITAAYSTDRDGNIDYSIANLVRVYCYNGNSNAPVVPENYTNTTTIDLAYNIFPSWTSMHTMDDLIFAIIRVDYNKEKNVTQLADMKFHMENSLTQPGDCLYDYMTNTRYGAGIAPEEIYSE